MAAAHQLRPILPSKPSLRSTAPYANPRTPSAVFTISNRHTPRPENPVTYTKQSLNLISTRHKCAFVSPVSVAGLGLSSASSLFISFDLDYAARIRTSRHSLSVFPAEIAFPILEFNVNHRKQTPKQFLIATKVAIRTAHSPGFHLEKKKAPRARSPHIKAGSALNLCRLLVLQFRPSIATDETHFRGTDLQPVQFRSIPSRNAPPSAGQLLSARESNAIRC